VIREIIFYKRYFINFYSSLDSKIQQKFDFVLQLIRTVERVPIKFLKHIESIEGLYEIRIEHASNIYRIFSFFDEGNIVVLLNTFQKKSRKTPLKEIDTANHLKKEYFSEKRKKNIKQ
jgi:phage-related protein